MASARTKGSAGEAVPEVAAARRHDLLEAAYLLVGERGLEGLRTRDVAARAGVNVSTLHYYFGTKEALLVALVGHASAKFAASPRRGRLAAPPATLRGHLERAWSTFQSTPHLATVLQELVLRGQRDAATRTAFRALHEDWNGLVEEVLAQERQRGALPAQVDPRIAARVVTSFIMGAVAQLGVNPKAFDFEEAARTLETWIAGGGAPYAG
ncbi:MAG TPA: TetR/AcrR family transcriptional regulator [Anaeromyxobacteraceae bacterium]|nr:TetR/AcrR family transcriptional regulator [Anaeromyxobacteraceae bacterium]